MAARTYRVEHKRDLRPEMAGFDWRLYTYGPGHWCVGTGHSGTFTTPDEAIAYGEAWIATGRGPADLIAQSQRIRAASTSSSKKAA